MSQKKIGKTDKYNIKDIKHGLKIALALIDYLRNEETLEEGENSDIREYEYRLKQVINSREEWVKRWIHTLPAFNDDNVDEKY